MQQMQDKEFDQLFRDKFTDAEMQPSANLWVSIEEHLVPQPKRMFGVYWVAAAVAITVLSLALLFHSTERIVLTKPELAATKKNVIMPAETTNQTTTSSSALVNTPLPIQTRYPHESNNKTEPVTVIEEPQKELIVLQPLKEIFHPVKSVQLKQEKAKLPELMRPIPLEEIVIANAASPEMAKDEVINENEQAPSKGIRNIGDLVNYVVDKVDKREEKLIQFQTDDDNSSLVAINIGMFRFNQKKHK